MIIVFGSVNLDLVASVERLPVAGETIAGRGFATSPGGKGANQALAARRAGAPVALFGAVGNDAFAAPALALLREDGVDVTGVIGVDAATGVAMIHVDAAGENAITVVAGANAWARAAQVSDAKLGASSTLLLQLETPAAEGLALARRARLAGSRVILNPAPAQPLDRGWLEAIDVLVINQTEACVLAQAFDIAGNARSFAVALSQRHGIGVILTLAQEGALAVFGDAHYEVPALSVPCVDTVGAGDAFVGAFAAALDRGDPLTRALAGGAAAGGLTCTRHGAQAALPHEEAIRAHCATVESGITICRTTA